MILSKRILLIAFITFWTISILHAQINNKIEYRNSEINSGGVGVPDNYLSPLFKPTAFEDRGTGYLSVGNILVGAIESYGSIGGWREPPWYTYLPLRVALVEFATLNCAFPPGGPKDLNGNPAIDELSITGQGKIYDFTYLSDVPTWNYQFTDWEAKDGARGQEMSGEVFSSSGKAILATSTNPKTWPEGYFDENQNWVSTPGERHWPGHWAVDSETGLEIPGQFAADEEIFLHINDKNNGTRPRGPEESGAPVGMEYEIQAYSFSRSYAKDFMFYNFKMTFSGDPDYDGEIELSAIDSLYMGIFWETLSPGAWMNEQGGMIWIGTDGAGNYNDRAKFIREKNLLITYDSDDFHQSDIYTGPVPRFGLALVKKPVDGEGKAWDITQWHWYDYLHTWSNYEISDRRQFYGISGDESVLQGARERDDWDHDVDNDGFDDMPVTDDVNLTSQIGIGPLHVEPGDTLEWAVAVIVGFTDEEILEKLELAQGMVDNNFIGPQAPPAPILHATGTKLTEQGQLLTAFDDPIVFSNDTKVTLYWDNTSENTPDPISGDQDLEGYKIYRSVNLGESWGIPGNDNAFVSDEKGVQVRWLPIAQFDKINGIQGRSELDPTFHLGDDTGLAHSWVDSTVITGLRYRYSITSYDAGTSRIEPLESAIGPVATSPNTVDIIVGPPPNGVQPVLSNIAHVAGHSDALLTMTVVDPFMVKGDDYLLTFTSNDPALAESTRVILENITTGEIIVNEELLPNAEHPSEEVFPIVDGIQFYLQDTPRGIISINDQDGIDLNSESNASGNGRIVTTILADISPVSYYRANDYEVRFLDSSQLSFAYNEDMSWAGRFGSRPYIFWSPVEVWDISNPESPTQLHWMMDDKRPFNQTFESLDDIYVMESPYSIEDSAGTGETGMWPDPDVPNTPGAWPDDYSLAIKVSGILDSLGNENWAIPNGDKIVIKSHHYLTPEDIYEVATQPQQLASELVDVNKIKVVPNPYIVRASYERNVSTKKIMFTNLPAKCKISIFTVSAEHIITLYHDNPDVGHLAWNLRTKENTDVAYGLFIYKIESEWGNSVGKFALIR